MKQSIQRQQGHAAMMFMLMFPLLLGIFALGVDGSKAMQDKARIEEASEVASLALTAQNSTDEAVNIDTANKYLKAYLPSAETQPNGIERLECEENPACDSNGDEFVQYTLAAQVENNTWFSANNVLGETYTATGGSIARKIVEQEEIPIEPIDPPIDPPPPPPGDNPPIDLVFALDFSVSMRSPEGDGIACFPNCPEKKDLLKEQVEKILDLLESMEPSEGEHRVGYSSFAGVGAAVPTDGDRACGMDQTGGYPNDYESVINKTFIEKDSSYCESSGTPTPVGERIMSSDFSNFFSNSGGQENQTGSYHSVIRSAQLMNRLPAGESRRIMVILSDGDDNHPNQNSNYSESLYSAGLCEHIREHLNVETYAFRYDYEDDWYTSKSLEICVGDDNVFNVSTTDEFYEILSKIITDGDEVVTPPPPPPEPVIGDREEIGHLF
ncbi:pilus assembly protein [Vibrio sp. SCSIO 43135]|uniref:TadE/TadG family type IV pilus assembly protein n=1 Tax=Vibrio sp. SCSIO 43135 TaxID=2819096 RepID=UPI0020753864|nr:TadE/TadG family type IV pilus assembly protein [Vibrio sp. SCSIO 43135]USD40095.1 pilus assembly protein [Vibrio sp. SCSIO 43135]